MNSHAMLPSLHALKNANYQFYFAGQLLSVSGTFMQGVAQSWLVYRMTQEATWLGIIAFCTQFPALILSPLAGAIADRMDRRKILLTVQWLFMLQAFILAALALTNQITVWQVTILSIFLGIITAFDMPTRHAFVVDMVGREDLPHAIALNSVTFNISRIIGPALAGLLIGMVGEKWCFALNGISYFAAIYGLSRIQTQPAVSKDSNVIWSLQAIFKSVAEGAHYVLAHRFICWIIIIMGSVTFFSSSIMVLLPVFAKNVLRGDAHTFALLSATIGVGAIFGALNIKADSGRDKFRKGVVLSIAMIGITFVIFGFSKILWLSLVAAFAAGYFNMSLYPRMNTAIQQAVDDYVRGRVLSIYTMVFLGTAPLGSLLTGWVSDRIGAPATIIISGIVCVLAASALKIRHYRKAATGFRFA